MLTVLLGLAAERQDFLAVTDSIDVFSARWEYVCIYNLCFVRLLLFENRVCCENSEMTARLSVALSVPELTAVVTVVSNFPASSIPFYIQHQRFFELLPVTYSF